MLILSQHDIDAIVSTIPLHSLLINQQQAFANYSTNTAQCPQRTVIPTLHHNVLFMPSRGSESGTALKVVSVPTSKQGGLPATTMLLDEESGRVECLLNAKDLTAVRTAAGSVVAVSRIQEHTPRRKMTVFGTGNQALWHTRYLREYYTIEEVVHVSSSSSEDIQSDKTKSRLRAFQERAGLDVANASIISQNDPTLSTHIRTSDLIVCCRASTTPLFRAEDVKPSTVVILVGSYKPTMRDVDGRLVMRAQKALLLDSRTSCALESGEIGDAVEMRLDLKSASEVGELVSRGEYVSFTDIAIFKSVGLAVQDSCIARLVYEKACEMRLGRSVEM